jgi:signal transduction histidine kinase
MFFNINAHINEDILEESDEFINVIDIDSNDSYLIQVDQWSKKNNNAVEVNPVFVQFFDNNNQLIDKSPNLKGLQLQLQPIDNDNQLVDSFLNGKPIRQIQIPLIKKNKKVGYLIVAMSLDEATLILDNLNHTLLISFSIILFLLFFIARFIAGRSIKPISLITTTTSHITKDNLKERIILPKYKDELFILSKTINDLLDRIENAVEREKQFTSDASHELRTPLTILKGTLEVLLRKPRTQVEYEEKINFGITEVDRLNNLVDQLLLLARFENQNQSLKKEKVYLNSLILDILARYSDTIKKNNIKINHTFFKEYYIESDSYLISIIFTNIISNAIKYSSKNGMVSIEISQKESGITCSISNNGIGILKEDLSKIFNPFYRSNPTRNQNIKGFGLGLSIVKRISQVLNIDLDISSEIEGLTIVSLQFLNTLKKE